MKSVLLFLSVLCFYSAAYSQSRIKVSEDHGDVFKHSKGGFDDVFELPSKNGFWSISSYYDMAGLVSWYGLGRSKRVYYVQRYDEDMNLVANNSLDLNVAGKNLTIEKIVRFQKDYYMFLSFSNVKKKKKYLFYARFDHWDLKLDSDIVKVAEAKLGANSKLYTKPSFDISISDDESFVVIFGKDARKIKKAKFFSFLKKSKKGKKSRGTHQFKFTYWVLDKDLEIVNYEKRHTLEIENSSDKFYVRDYVIDKDGAIYILGKNTVVDALTRSEVKKNKRTSWIDIHKSAFILEKIYPDGTTEVQTTPADQLFVDMDILFDKDGNINLLGLKGEQVYSKLVTTGVSRLIMDKKKIGCN